jgi:hypothetical protein
MRKLVVFIVPLLLFFLFAGRSLAQPQIQISSPNAQTGTSFSEVEKVEYVLPYPGILPDNPLYIFKAIRDRIISLLINDPLKRAEFDLLNADKRLNAGIFLAKKGKDALSVSTISKGNNYFDEGIGRLYDAKKAGRDIKPLLERFSLSAKKREEEMTLLLRRINPNFSDELKKELSRVQEMRKRLDRLFPQK